MNILYLDSNATAPMLSSVSEAMASVYQLPYGLNASSTHRAGREARGIMEEARKGILTALGAAQDDELIFTGSGTEANNMLILGHAKEQLLISTIEHSSILKPADQSSCFVHHVPVDPDGVLDLVAFEQLLEVLKPSSFICSVMLANNETGVIQPIQKIARLVHRYGGYLHSDASQALGKIPVDLSALEVDALTISAHKFGGPQGVGALIKRKTLSLKPRIIGGGQEGFARAGTENIAGIVGLYEAVKQLPNTLIEMQKLVCVRDQMEANLLEISPGTIIVSKGAIRLPNTSCITMPGVGYETQIMHFDIEHISVSAGSACSSGKVEVSHVLQAIGISNDEAKTAIRVSLPAYSLSSDVKRFVAAWKVLYERCREKRVL